MRHLRRMRRLYKNKWLHLVELLKAALPEQAQLSGQSAGMHLLVETPGLDDTVLLRLMQQAGFGGDCLSACYLNKAAKQGVILGFANTDELQRENCVNYLAKIIGERYSQG